VTTLAIAAFVVIEFAIVGACPVSIWLDWRC